MILEKVINKIEIQSEYKEFVDKYIDHILTEFQDKIHSIYMCGSIPKGTATPFKSDADFTIICANPKDIDYGRLSAIKDKLLAEYAFVTKIDTIICSMDEVLSKPNEWGFWVKIICVCVYGDDIGEKIPPIIISPDFIVDLNRETKEEIERIVQRILSNADDRTLTTRYIKGYSKRLLRALYSLILEDTGVWEDDMLEMKNALLKYCAIDSGLVEYLYACYLDSDVPVEEFLGIANEVYRYFENALNRMAASRTSFE
ncbi:nucleotidyltransferase domain-containing protein [Paenibacillus hunanensis]|uniref:Nucleotidyltransferase n=1 Tax=Paenibacillus hunanensis TaxID=539262 RepID=A0ABU1ISG6_9BACL|nr:nucleotidyltransferase domain-containing protein [Paenibacillus hunanensis]MDR6242192.1 putative nucleotidyltransferase [Paenibacillus hunanensis]GGJ05997.1 nucleotidyltransferase [Paenibacillus hunanensis]